MKRVMMVGSAENSNGGVSTVIKSLKNSIIWNRYNCYWLGTQIQKNKLTKLFYAIKSYLIAFCIIWRYDIIHFHTVPDISLIVQLPIYQLARLWKKKIILHLHVGNQIEDYKNSNLFHYCIKHSDQIILLSKSWKDIFDNLFSQYNKKTDYLYNACTTVKAIEYKQHNKTIAYAAHMNTNKAYDILLKAFAQIKDSYPDWKLIMMGDGEVEKAKKMAQELNINDQVIFTGYITGKEKETYFQKASIFCMCSYQEGFPMVVLEAWSYGIPVITTPVGGLPDVIEEGKNAITFNFGDYQELAKKLELLINNYDKRYFMSSYVQDFAETNFSINSISNKLSTIYKNLSLTPT